MFKKILNLFMLSGFFLCLINISFAKEPINLARCKADVMRYHNSGEYQKDQQAVINKGLNYLHTYLIRTHLNKKPAIVLDIDETALSNYPDMVKMNFGGTLAQMMAASDRGTDPAILPTLQLYRDAKQQHVAVFFVTGRRVYERAATEKNLLAAGYHHWDQLILRANDDHSPVALWKARMRAVIEKAGYDIVLNIGDQDSDLRGDHADLSLKLPNPYYVIP